MKRSRWLAAALFLLTGALALAAPEEFVFTGYNVENYLTTERRDESGKRTASPKPEKEKEAVVRVIKDIAPAILGVSEMGSREDLADLQKRLTDAGLDFPHSEWVDAPDPDRHLALLSKFPIVSRQSVVDAKYELGGREEFVRRGFLDVTLRVNPDYDLRVVGVHLKSKRAVDEGEALVRRNEAHLLRKHVEKIIADNPDVNLLLYGDFNDTKNEPPIQEIMGVKGQPNYMADLWLKDELGDRWTHFWKYADIYSRIDYIFVSRALWPEIDMAKSGIYRSPYWEDASDHRAVSCTIKAENRAKPVRKK